MNNKVKDLVYCALGACMIAMGAQISITLPITLVPITMQTLVIYLLAILFTTKNAVMSCIIYLLLGAIGLPVFAGFSGGLMSLFTPAGGYLMSYPLMALTIRYLSKNKIFAMILGTVVCYGVGTVWFMYVTQMNLYASLMMCVVPFILGDGLKIMMTYFITIRINKV